MVAFAFPPVALEFPLLDTVAVDVELLFDFAVEVEVLEAVEFEALFELKLFELVLEFATFVFCDAVCDCCCDCVVEVGTEGVDGVTGTQMNAIPSTTS